MEIYIYLSLFESNLAPTAEIHPKSVDKSKQILRCILFKRREQERPTQLLEGVRYCFQVTCTWIVVEHREIIPEKTLSYYLLQHSWSFILF
jgi:hypothetical protein